MLIKGFATNCSVLSVWMWSGLKRRILGIFSARKQGDQSVGKIYIRRNVAAPMNMRNVSTEC